MPRFFDEAEIGKQSRGRGEKQTLDLARLEARQFRLKAIQQAPSPAHSTIGNHLHTRSA